MRFQLWLKYNQHTFWNTTRNVSFMPWRH